MQPGPELTNRQILSNPVEAYTALYPEVGGQTLDTLENLWFQHQKLKKRRYEIRSQANIISREIGKAKRAGQPYQSLMLSMQEMSNKLKAIDGSLKQAEHQNLC